MGKLLIKRFYEIVRYNKPDTVCIVGGEPLLYLDFVEEIVKTLKPVCGSFLVYSNGSFLLDENKRNRVRDLGIQVRISKTKFHKDFWNEDIEKLINDSRKQIILVSHNATIPMLGDAQNIVLCRNDKGKIKICSQPLEGNIDNKSIVDYIAEITDGGKSSIKKRVKKYNLKSFKENEG